MVLLLKPTDFCGPFVHQFGLMFRGSNSIINRIQTSHTITQSVTTSSVISITSKFRSIVKSINQLGKNAKRSNNKNQWHYYLNCGCYFQIMRRWSINKFAYIKLFICKFTSVIASTRVSSNDYTSLEMAYSNLRVLFWAAVDCSPTKF